VPSPFELPTPPPKEDIGLVEPGDLILPEHHNKKRAWLKTIFDHARKQIPMTIQGEWFLNAWSLIREVKEGDPVLAIDHNFMVDAIQKLYDYLEPWVFDTPESVALMNRFKELSTSVRKVAYGDYVMAQDHNTLVEMIQILYDLCKYLIGPRIMSSALAAMVLTAGQIPLFVVPIEVVG